MEYLLWAYFLLFPIYIYLTIENEKKIVMSQPEKRMNTYINTITMLWLPVGLLLALLFQKVLLLSDIGLIINMNWVNMLAIIAVALLAVYFFNSIKQIQRCPKSHEELREQMAYIRWLMPTNQCEYRYFVFGVSVSAGICEELLFRGYLMHVLSDVLPTYGAIIVSSLLFGLPHIYQGGIHVLRTAVIGFILALIYWVTDSLLVPIILHVLIDMYGAALGYTVFKTKQPPQNVAGNLI